MALDVVIDVAVEVEQIGHHQPKRFVTEERRVSVLESHRRDQHLAATVPVAPADSPRLGFQTKVPRAASVRAGIALIAEDISGEARDAIPPST
jgi:hypothetical protein